MVESKTDQSLYVVKYSTVIKKISKKYVHYRCRKAHIKKLLKNIGISYKLQPSFLKQEMNHAEIHEVTWEDKEDKLVPYLKNEVLSSAFSYARYSKRMGEKTRFDME